MKKRLNANLYTIDSYVYHRDGCELKSLPDGRLYSGWGTQFPTKITADDLPEWYVYLRDYKRHGYLNTKGVKCAYYINSIFDNHWLKDSNLIISYVDDSLPIPPRGDFSRYQSGWYDIAKWDNKSRLYIWGSDILVALKGIEKYSPEIDTTEIRKGIIEDYNVYTKDRNKWVRPERGEVPEPYIDTLDEILEQTRLRL